MSGPQDGSHLSACEKGNPVFLRIGYNTRWANLTKPITCYVHYNNILSVTNYFFNICEYLPIKVVSNMHMVTNTTEAQKSEDFFVIFIITYKSNNQHNWDNRFAFFFMFFFSPELFISKK